MLRDLWGCQLLQRRAVLGRKGRGSWRDLVGGFWFVSRGGPPKRWKRVGESDLGV